MKQRLGLILLGLALGWIGRFGWQEFQRQQLPRPVHAPRTNASAAEDATGTTPPGAVDETSAGDPAANTAKDQPAP